MSLMMGFSNHEGYNAASSNHSSNYEAMVETKKDELVTMPQAAITVVIDFNQFLFDNDESKLQCRKQQSQ